MRYKNASTKKGALRFDRSENHFLDSIRKDHPTSY